MPDTLLDLVRAIQQRAECHLGGGAVLAGVHLVHRRTRDLDLFFHNRDLHREVVRALPEVSSDLGIDVAIVRDGGSFVRAVVRGVPFPVELDLVYELAADIEPPPPPIEGILVESLTDLRASKLTCLLSRAEPRDLVDLLFLDRAGFPPEDDLSLALEKDAGIDPGILAWLLEQYPTSPMPDMLARLTQDELAAFRDELRERFRRIAVPE